MAILNTDINYSVEDSVPIVIYVSGGEHTSPYYNFSDENGVTINIIDGTYKFMRGRTYQFIANGISTSHPFKIGYNKGLDETSSITSGSITVIMSDDDNENSYYQCNSHSGMKGNLSFLYNSVNGTEYNFYYGDINVEVNSNFNTSSIYCYYDGYMGGQNLLVYSDTCDA